MKKNNNTTILRSVRKIHRWLAVTSFVLLLVISITGILLGLKKHVGDFIQPESYEGTTSSTSEWFSFDSLKTVAFRALHDAAGPGLSTRLDRIDARPSKGMVKFIFTDHYWEVQVDAATAEVLHVSRRNSDIIENIHDGSIIDHLLGIREGYFKLIYTSVLGLTLMVFTLTGLWLWYKPRQIKREKNNNSHTNARREFN